MSNLNNNLGTPKFKAKLEFETEKCREEGKWQKVLQLTTQMINNNSDKSLIQFLLGESKLELYLDLMSSATPTSASTTGSTGTNTKSLLENKDKLIEEAEEHLKNCLNSASSSPLCIDVNLLLAKLFYAKKAYEKTIKYIEASGIENVTQVEKALPLRVMKLITESFAIKGMALEYLAESNQDDAVGKQETSSKLFPIKSSELKNTIESRIFCLTKSTDLTLRYLQNIEKQHGQYALISIGSIMETAIQRAPLLYIKNSQLNLALNQYRSILNAVECKATSNCRQIIARQLTEVIMRGVSRNCWKPFDLNSMAANTGFWKPHRYTGQTIFNPQQREEELLLLLLIAEQQAAANVVLERSQEFDKSRKESLNNVIAIYDLFTIAFTPLRYFAVDLFEKAMKFSFEVKHIWLQFGLTLLESRKSPQRCLQIFDEVSRIDKTDPLPLLIQAKIYLTDQFDPEASLVYSTQALDVLKAGKQADNESLLLPRCYLLIGIANALLYERQNEFNKSQMKHHLHESIRIFKLMAKCSPHDHLAYYHLALSYANRRMINEAILNLQISLTLNPVHLPTVQLLIICLTSLKRYKEALILCESALQEFPNQLLLLFIKANIQQNVCEDGLQEALMTAKEMLSCLRLLNCNQSSLENAGGGSGSGGGQLKSGANSNREASNYHLTGLSCDSMSLRMEQTLSEVASIDSNLPLANAIGAPVSSNTTNEISQLDHTTTLINSHSGIALSQHSGSNISSGLGAGSTASSFQQQLVNMQMQVWILVSELFIKLGQLDEAESCLIENCQQQVFGILSHQLMYIKGKLCIARGQLNEAKILLQSCISINPRHSNALQQLGLTYHLAGNHMSAEKYLRDSLNCDANCVETWSIMGRVLEKLGDTERAINCHLTALKLEETESVLPFNIVPRTIFE